MPTLTKKRYTQRLKELQSAYDLAIENGDHKTALRIQQQIGELDGQYLGASAEPAEAPALFSTQAKAVDYLKSLGYRINTSTFGHHVKDKSLVTKGSKGFARHKLEEYAEKHLERDLTADQKSVVKSAVEKKAELDNQLLEIKINEKLGQLIDREEVEEQWCARYSLFKESLENAVRNRCRRWVLLCAGKEEFVADLTDEIIEDLRVALDALSRSDEVEVTFEEEEAD